MAQITISDLANVTTVTDDTVLPLESAETNKITIGELRKAIGGVQLSLGMILHAVGVIDSELLHLLDGSTLLKIEYPEFYAEVVKKCDALKWRAVDQATYDAEIAQTGQCGAFVINADSVVLPKIVRFIGSIESLADIGVTKQDQMQGHAHNIIKPQSYAGAGTGYRQWYETRDGVSGGVTTDGVNGDPRTGEETYPTHTMYPYYIVVRTAPSALLPPTKGGALELFDKVYRNSHTNRAGRCLAGTKVPSLHTGAYDALKAEYEAGTQATVNTYTVNGSPTFDGDMFTCTGTSALLSNFVFAPGDKSWSLNTKFVLTGTSAAYRSMFGQSKMSRNYKTPQLKLNTSSRLQLDVSVDGTTWTALVSNELFLVDRAYYVRAGYDADRAVYYLRISTDKTNWTEVTLPATNVVYQDAESIFCFGNDSSNLADLTEPFADGAMSVSETYVQIGDQRYGLTLDYMQTSTGKKIADISDKPSVDAVFDTNRSTFYVIDTANKNFYLPKDKRRTLLRATDNYSVFSDSYVEQHSRFVSPTRSTALTSFNVDLVVDMLNTNYDVTLSGMRAQDGTYTDAMYVSSYSTSHFTVSANNQVTGTTISWMASGYADPSQFTDVELDLEYYYVGDDVDDPAVITAEAVVTQVNTNTTNIETLVDAKLPYEATTVAEALQYSQENPLTFVYIAT